MDRYTLSLALFDFLPVAAGGIGMYLVCRYCSIVGQRVGAWVFLVPLLIFTGGMLKASWKTIVVVAGNNIQWMSDALFFFLASGYILVATLVVRAFRRKKEGARAMAAALKLRCTESCPRDIPVTKAIEEVRRELLWRRS